ncbi:MSMEG_6728 family protein [Candidatus Pacearchaeota archaeon]|nr:MSMEG_6728 family protein [Candidatus Pacearchaeota archaeon]
MQTFLPYPNLKKSLKALDSRRLGKQRVEAFQILNILLERTDKKGWQNHPAVKMWRGYENALKLYFNKSVKLWIARGYKNTMKLEKIEGKIILPKWFGDKNFHDSHKSNLLRKDGDFYFEFSENVSADLGYVWP